MMKFLVTADGGLTTMGYVTFVVAVIVLIAIIAVLFFKNGNAKKLTTQQLVTCAVALALAYVTSYIKLFKLPFGGSVTLFSMLFIVLIGYWYGPKVGILTGLVYGIFQFLVYHSVAAVSDNNLFTGKFLHIRQCVNQYTGTFNKLLH